MTRTWLSVTVELLGGRGEELWPWPGRVFAVGPAHTFQELADAINGAFARWDRSHLSMFTLADGRIVTDHETAAEVSASSAGPVVAALDMVTARVARIVVPGAEFQFTFDFGDDWTHRCVVGPDKVDPLEVIGVRPEVPLPYWGWGTVPDQYGRRWAGDDGESRPPRRPPRMHPMLLGQWPTQQQVRAVDLSEVRAAVAGNDVDRFLTAISGAEIGDALHQVAPGVSMLLDSADDRGEPMAISLVNRLSRRGWVGDDVLIEDLLAQVRSEPALGRVVPVDLEMLSTELESDPGMSSGGYVDLHTGQVVDDVLTDAMMVGEDAAIDVEQDPDRWLRVNPTRSRDAWQDIADFAAGQHDEVLRNRMQHAIEGKGAFRRFRDLVNDNCIAEAWYAYSTDRQLGRARAFLAAAGIRVALNRSQAPN